MRISEVFEGLHVCFEQMMKGGIYTRCVGTKVVSLGNVVVTKIRFFEGGKKP